MRQLSVILATLLAIQFAAPLHAQGNSGKAGAGAHSACPPGLAKKGCIPPGQAKAYGRGDIIQNFRHISNPGKWARRLLCQRRWVCL